ncbi:hypothetical protein TNIN_16531 [Trichonephila inaurata madagascariensis]|uniref:Uncharacterized protein n=1 Tax=Trichonephila inaurata madagascariensis TaxID=2747483 RepID=A0A8X6WWF7_9ARAC|nr:hypothetical protein TNIN_16531 [Trichonephila inaurata madagascariensis]
MDYPHTSVRVNRKRFSINVSARILDEVVFATLRPKMGQRTFSFDYNNRKSQNLVGSETDPAKEKAVREKLLESTIHTGGFPNEIIFIVDKPNIITGNIDATDDLANGDVGILSHFELDDQNRVLRV